MKNHAVWRWSMRKRATEVEGDQIRDGGSVKKDMELREPKEEDAKDG